jgi:hypothetical protein
MVDGLYFPFTVHISQWDVIDKDEESSSWWGKGLFSETFRSALRPTQRVLEALFPEVKPPRHEADHLPLSSAKVKN